MSAVRLAFDWRKQATKLDDCSFSCMENSIYSDAVTWQYIFEYHRVPSAVDKKTHCSFGNCMMDVLSGRRAWQTLSEPAQFTEPKTRNPGGALEGPPLASALS